MAEPDRVLKQAFAWYKASIGRALGASGLSLADQTDVTTLLWEAFGLKTPAAPPAIPDLVDFKEHNGAKESLAVAATIVGEALVALGYVQQAVAAAGGGGLPAALAVVDPVLQQIERLRNLDATARYPSALTIGKILLMLSGDAQANPAASHEADKLSSLLGAASAADIADTQAALGIVALLIGSLIDRTFTAPISGASPLITQGLPNFAGKPKLTLKVPAAVAPSLGGSIEFNVTPPSAIKAALTLAVNKNKPIDGTDVTLKLTGTPTVSVLVPVAPPGSAQVSSGYSFGLELTRKKAGGALVISNDQVTISIGELGVALQLQNGEPLLRFSAHDAMATIRPSDGFLRMILGDGVKVALDVVVEADKAGTLRFINGTGLRVSLPVPTLPTGPFELQFINLGLNPAGGSFTNLQIEVSASFGVALGPFAASVDRLGIIATLKGGAAGRDVQFAFKPPNGIGLSLDAGIVKGGGYLGVDEQGYAGILELKMMAVDVKAICLLNTHSEAGFSLLLLIFGQFPPIQLSFGFTLTGIGGLIGVQHTASPPALSQALGAGNLDAVLFPENPVANAPQIINTLRAMFPIKRGGFIIGPMLELGWGTPSLVTVRMGLLIEGDGFTLLGQAIVQVPPLLSADLALLYLRMDFVGGVTFDPLGIWMDAKLIHSRVALISITGQFAFRARFGDQPTFIISAGGFHPRFKEIPSDIPSPFDRVGASLDIGIVGIELKGYFAITSATIQAGAALRAWADIGIASIEGGIGFDAICYLVPKFYFELDIFAYLDVHVFGIDFASIHLDGLLAGPGRWHIAGNAKVHTPWPLPDFSVHIDESWGTDRDTPQITVKVGAELAKEIGKRANWSAQLPQGGTGMVTLADINPGTDVLAHPLGTLLFQQKLVPFELRMAKASGSKIDGANEFGEGALRLSQSGQTVAGLLQRRPRTDFFAAAQFLEMSQADKLAKPSFEAFTAGYELGDDNFELGETVPVTLNYEEADLGAEELLPRAVRLRITSTLYSEDKHGAMLAHGAAGRSSLRNLVLTQPAQPAPIRVDPAPVIVAAKDSMVMTAGASVHTSVWRAHQERDANTQVAVAGLAVVELAEIA
jgi:hypothetical protein